MSTAVIDNKGDISFIHNKANYDVFPKISQNTASTIRAGTINVFTELTPEQQTFILNQNPNININLFWVVLESELHGPFEYREDAVNTEQDLLRSRGYA